MEKEDWILAEGKGRCRDRISEQEERSGVRRVELSNQYRTIKVKRSKNIRAEKSDGERR